MTVLSPLLTVVVVLFVPLFVVVAVRYRDRAFPASWSDQQLAGAVAGVVDEAVAGRAGGQGLRPGGRRAGAPRIDRPRPVRARGCARPASPPATPPPCRPCPALGQVGVLGVGGWLALRGPDHGRRVRGVLQLPRPAGDPGAHALDGHGDEPAGPGGPERIFELLDLQPGSPTGPAPSPLEAPVRAGRARRRDVRVRGRAPPVLRDVSLAVAPGERLAVVGRLGIGEVDAGPPARPVRTTPTRARSASTATTCACLTLGSVRRAVGLVHEEAFLFSTTVAREHRLRPARRRRRPRSSARPGRRRPHGFVAGAGRRLRHGRRRAGAHAVGWPAAAVGAGPGGPRQPAGAGARRRHLSGRRPHRGGDPRLVRRVMADRTTIVIAHRASTLRRADRVVVLDGGRVVAEGTHDQLLATSARYRELLAGGTPDVEPDEGRPLVPPPTTDSIRSPGPRRARKGAGRVSSQAGRRPRARHAATPAAWAAGRTGSAGAPRLVAATPELLAQVRALPPATDEPAVDLGGHLAHRRRRRRVVVRPADAAVPRGAGARGRPGGRRRR